MLNILFTTSTSAAFEWQGNEPYYTEREYTVFLDGEVAHRGNTKKIIYLTESNDD